MIILFLYAWKTGQNKLAKSLAYGGFFLFIPIAFMLWFQHQHTGDAIYINPTGKGFFPENLLHLGPVVPASLIDFQLYDLYLSRILHISYPQVIIIWKWLNGLLLLGLLSFIFRYYQNNGFHMERPLHIYMNIALAISIVIFLLLAYLSFTQAPYSTRFTPFWTYVEELRYYAAILIFIPQGILFLLLYRRDLLSGYRKIFIPVITIVVAITIVHGFYHLSKQIFIKKDVGKNRVSELLDFQDLQFATRLSNSGEKLVICSDSYELANMASLTGIPVLYEYDRLNAPLHTSKTLILLVVLNRQELAYFKNFFSLHHPTQIFPYGHQNLQKGINFYLLKFH
jgi:hypothetical protein